MEFHINDLMELISSGVFQNMLGEDTIQIPQFLAVVTLLVKNRIPFDTKYTPGNRRDDPTFTLTVYIAPKVTMDFSFSGLNLTDAS